MAAGVGAGAGLRLDDLPALAIAGRRGAGLDLLRPDGGPFAGHQPAVGGVLCDARRLRRAPDHRGGAIVVLPRPADPLGEAGGLRPGGRGAGLPRLASAAADRHGRRGRAAGAADEGPQERHQGLRPDRRHRHHLGRRRALRLRAVDLPLHRRPPAPATVHDGPGDLRRAGPHLSARVLPQGRPLGDLPVQGPASQELRPDPVVLPARHRRVQSHELRGPGGHGGAGDGVRGRHDLPSSHRPGRGLAEGLGPAADRVLRRRPPAPAVRLLPPQILGQDQSRGPDARGRRMRRLGRAV